MTVPRYWHEMWGLVVGYYGQGRERLGPTIDEFFATMPLFGERTELCRLMRAEGSDKSGAWHTYTLFYDFLYRRRRAEVANVFEMGIGTNHRDLPSNMGSSGRPGASLRGWRAYFPKARILGADIDGRIMFSDERIETRRVDQLDADSVKALWAEFPDRKFDLIVDDGLHELEANRNLLQHSLHKLDKDGYYVIEDIVCKDDNIRGFGEFFQSFGAAGVMLKLPCPANVGDNCIAVFRAPVDP